MQFTPDALQWGPLALEWGRLSLILALLTLLAVLSRAKDQALERSVFTAIIVGVIAARVGFILEHWASFRGAGVLEFVDVRSGGLSWWWALVALVPLVRIRSRARWERLGFAVFAALIAAGVPFLFKPKLQTEAQTLPDTMPFERISQRGTRDAITWKDLEKPVLVNVWASWCGPCRAEMPVLADAAKRGARIAFVNAGETPETIAAYLAQERLELPVLVDAGALRSTLQVVGLPTSFLVDVNGQVIQRHFGPLDRGQLQVLLGRLDSIER